jgi:hypothetical protein
LEGFCSTIELHPHHLTIGIETIRQLITEKPSSASHHTSHLNPFAATSSLAMAEPFFTAA